MPKSRNPKTGRYESSTEKRIRHFAQSFPILTLLKPSKTSKWQVHTHVVYLPRESQFGTAHKIYFISRIEDDITVYHKTEKGDVYSTTSFWEARSKVKFLNDND